ncbi:MAG: NnrS family protein [Gammaproteobacteria bacterium]|nr:NnrS family protein [Gammaproteobacteria bacterium]
MTAPCPDAVRPLWRLAFRFGFLAAAAFAVMAMGRWLLWILWPASWHSGLPPTWWHAHEMVFGFAMPVVAGFLLTAVATWTGIQGTRGWRLQLLFGLWGLARAVLWLAPAWALAAWLAEMLFISGIMFELGQRVWARRQWRNMLFLPVLLLLALLDSASYLHANDPVLASRLHFGAVWMVATLVVIIGGRVIPLFTANRLGLQIAPLPAWFEAIAIGSAAMVGLAMTLPQAQQGGAWLRLFCIAAGFVHLYRLARWQGWKTRRVPLLWSMHLAYLCIPLAMLGLGLAGTDPVATRSIIHLLAIGTIGGMILSMMSRVSLGHTGHPLDVPVYLAWAFALLAAAAVVRALLPLLSANLTPWSWRISALLWIFAFGCFLYRYLPILTRARVDGKPG